MFQLWEQGNNPRVPRKYSLSNTPSRDKKTPFQLAIQEQREDIADRIAMHQGKDNKGGWGNKSLSRLERFTVQLKIDQL
jgi:hypothetical protein